MSTLYIHTTSFLERTILCNINYIFQEEIENVILLKENHEEDENFAFFDKVNILLFENLEECISKCDIALIIMNEKIPSYTIQKIQHETTIKNKRCYVITANWITDSNIKNCKKAFNSLPSDEIPIVLHISQGISSQPYYVEIALNKILREKGIQFLQVFTDETRQLLQQFDDYQILNKDISLYLNKQIKEIDLYIYSINIGKDICKLNEYIELFKTLKVDYVILQTDFEDFNYENIYNSIKLYCFSDLDKIIKSHYFIFDEKFYVYCKEDIKKDNNYETIDVESKDLGENIYTSIISKLSLPEGISRII